MKLFLIDDEQLFLRTLAGDAFKARDTSKPFAQVTQELFELPSELNDFCQKRMKKQREIMIKAIWPDIKN